MFKFIRNLINWLPSYFSRSLQGRLTDPQLFFFLHINIPLITMQVCACKKRMQAFVFRINVLVDNGLQRSIVRNSHFEVLEIHYILRLVISYYKGLQLTATSLMLNDSPVNRNLSSSTQLQQFSSYGRNNSLSEMMSGKKQYQNNSLDQRKQLAACGMILLSLWWLKLLLLWLQMLGPFLWSAIIPSELREQHKWTADVPKTGICPTKLLRSLDLRVSESQRVTVSHSGFHGANILFLKTLKSDL